MHSLVIDDNPDILFLMEKLLKVYGVCALEKNGAEGLKRFENAHQQKHPFDLICIDIYMPGIDGHTVLRRIRRTEEAMGLDKVGRSKIIMITSINEKNHLVKCFQEQCDSYLVKPIEAEKFIDYLDDLGLLL